MFSEMESTGLIKEKQTLVETCNHIANTRRQKTFDDLTKRNQTIIQVIFYLDLIKIVVGKGNFKGIGVSVRRKCFEDLVKFITDDFFKINLIVAKVEDVPHIRKYLRDYERLSICGNKFPVWGYHSAKIVWSENSIITKRHRKVLKELNQLFGLS